MYHVHFGLERGLFDEGIAADAAVFRNSKHDRLIAHFKLALASASASIVLQGPAGVGKTTLTSTALRALSTRLALAWLNGMPTNAAELLELILIELGVSTLRTTRIERLQLWRQFQAEMRATDSRLLIVAERTEDLSVEVLHALDQLTAPDAVGNPGANLVLLGHAGIHEHLAAPLLDSLRQRIRLRAELEPFTEPELEDYLRHQTARAGGHYDHLFAPGTVAALYGYSNGVARLVNTLCESALDIAAVQHHKQLTPDFVARTAVSLLGLAEPASAARPVASAAPVAGAPVETRPAPRATATAPPAIIVERRSEPRVPAVPPSAPARVAEPAPAPPKPVAIEYDGSATDVADVAIADFPILTDAVEPPAPAAKQAPAAPAKTGPAPQAATTAPPQSRSIAPAPPPAPVAAAPAKPPPKPASQVETAYAAARPATKPTAAPAVPAPALTPLPHAAAVKPNAPPLGARPSLDPQDDDELRQTQTMRAIAGAKSIDDICEIDAETLFSDAELDLVSAALASAAEWPDDDEKPAAVPAPAPSRLGAPKVARSPPSRPEAAKAAAPAPSRPAAPVEEDPFDLFGLGDDAPLELIDDSTLPPHARKTAAR